eukprot:197369_1
MIRIIHAELVIIVGLCLIIEQLFSIQTQSFSSLSTFLSLHRCNKLEMTPSDSKHTLLLDNWAMIRPGSNVSALYMWFTLWILNIYISSSLLSYIQYLIAICVLIIWIIIIVYGSDELLHAVHLRRTQTSSFGDKLLSFLSQSMMTFLMIPHFGIAFRLLTYKWRKLPDFYILGEAKCGTTTLSRLLDQLGCQGAFSMLNHFVSQNKESLYWIGYHSSFLTTPKYYSMCFPLKIFHDATVKVYDATVDCLWFAFIHKRIHKVTSHAKMIILVRNPIHRTKSHLQFILHEAEELQPIFVQKIALHQDMTQVIRWYYDNDEMVRTYLDAQEQVGVEESVPHYVPMMLELPMIHRSMYYRNIKRLLKTFDREQILVVDVEELNANMCATLAKICDFIDLDVDQTDLVRFCDEKKHTTPCHNKSIKQVEITEKERNELYQIFEPQNEKLFEWLGKDLGWNV